MKQALVAVLVALSLLQSVRVQEETEENQSTNRCGNQPIVLNVDHYLLQLNSKLDTLALSLETLKSKLEVLDTNLLEHKQDTAAELAQLQASLTTTQSSLATHTQQVNSKLSFLTTSLSEHKQQTTAELAQLQTSLTSTYSKLESLNTSLSEHKEGTTAELAILQTSLTATESSLTTSIWQSYNLLDSGITSTQSSVEAANSKLDTIVTTAIQLTSDHQELHTGISELDCVDTEELHQYLQNNLTCQLEGTQDHGSDSSEVQGPYTCGGTTGWRCVVYLDMTDPSTTCPSGWQLTGYSKRTCGRASTVGATCDSVTFPVSGGEYSRVCGRIKAYQWGATLAFYFYSPITSIDGAYISGLSLTHGDPREHIWTFAAGVSEQQYQSGVSSCPCDTNNFEYWNSRVPSFIGNDYFCESGLNTVWGTGSYGYFLFPDDPLWDGENCPTGTCCSFSNPPFFSKSLDSSTSDDLELRLCNRHTSTYSDVPVELIELYVQ